LPSTGFFYYNAAIVTYWHPGRLKEFSVLQGEADLTIAALFDVPGPALVFAKAIFSIVWR
jgi:hypothetical protein